MPDLKESTRKEVEREIEAEIRAEGKLMEQPWVPENWVLFLASDRDRLIENKEWETEFRARRLLERKLRGHR